MITVPLHETGVAPWLAQAVRLAFLLFFALLAGLRLHGPPSGLWGRLWAP